MPIGMSVPLPSVLRFVPPQEVRDRLGALPKSPPGLLPADAVWRFAVDPIRGDADVSDHRRLHLVGAPPGDGVVGQHRVAGRDVGVNLQCGMLPAAVLAAVLEADPLL